MEPDERVVETVQAAIALGSELDAANPAGDTALHIPVGQGRDAVTQLLVESGARLDVRNRRGQTALGLLMARSAGTARMTPARTALLDLMRQRGAVE